MPGLEQNLPVLHTFLSFMREEWFPMGLALMCLVFLVLNVVFDKKECTNVDLRGRADE